MNHFLSIIFIAISVTLHAWCPSNGISVWPSKLNIKQNSIFILDACADSKTTVAELGKKHKIYLKSNDEIVNLIVTETLIGQFNSIQAILKPEKNLTVGSKYELVIENLPKKEMSITRYNEALKTNESLYWQVIEGVDSIAPQWIKPASFKKATYKGIETNNAKYAYFKCQLNEDTECFVKAFVKNINSGITTTFYLRVYENEISIGHSTCSGAFIFNDNTKYAVIFDLMDASGNVTKWGADSPLIFDAPMPKPSIH